MAFVTQPLGLLEQTIFRLIIVLQERIKNDRKPICFIIVITIVFTVVMIVISISSHSSNF